MLIFRPNQKKIRSRFLFEFLKSRIFQSQIEAHSTGAAQPQLPIKILVNFVIQLPSSLEEQDQLVDYLNALATETRRLEAIYQRKLAALAELKQSLLQRAFAGEL
jgi:type I restriction enzyme S subunit